MAEAFTWFSKLTDVLEQVPDEGMRQRLAYAIVMYGSMDVEPELEWPLNALFEAVREDIDNSRAARVRGRKGGRPRKARKEDGAAAEDAQGGPSGHGTTEDAGFSAQEAAPTDSATVSETTSEDGPEADGTTTRSGLESDETTGSQTQKPDSQTGFANSKTIGFENPKTSGFAIGETQAKPSQAKPNQAKPNQRGGARGRPHAPAEEAQALLTAVRRGGRGLWPRIRLPRRCPRLHLVVRVEGVEGRQPADEGLAGGGAHMVAPRPSR